MLDLLLSNCANVPVPEATAEAMRYYNSGNVLWIVSQVWTFLVPLLFLVTGFSGWLGRFSQRIGRNWFFTIVAYLTVFTIITQLLNFPLDYYSSFVREHAYNMSNQTFGRWMDSWTKSSMLALVGSLLFIWIFYLVLKKSPRRWWLYGSIVTIVLTFILTFIQPIWIAPMFNHFGPMKNKELEGQILSLASRAGIEGGRVYEVDMSQDTKKLNAYVNGLGSTSQIVLWDTTIAKLTPDEILFVMGHEMGHYVLHHMWWGFGFFSLFSFLVFYLTYRSSNYLIGKYSGRFGFNNLANIASFPLLLLLVNFYSFLFQPAWNYYSRTIEHNADTFGLEITQNNQAAGDSFVVLIQDNLGNPRPGPIYKFWRCTHPPCGERIDYFNSYCPWTEGKPLKYGKYFH